jgi:hypothetical protein
VRENPRIQVSARDEIGMPDHPKARPREEGEDSEALAEHKRMILALQEAAARLARAREALNQTQGASKSADADPEREW